MSPKHLHRYVAEFAMQHNHRTMDTIDQMKQIVKHAQSKCLSYSELIS